jgi:outer membrane protein, heavy metal efflux system
MLRHCLAAGSRVSLFVALALLAVLSQTSYSQQPSFTWQQIRDRFEASNPALLADTLNVNEAKAQEIIADLRPNPNFTLLTDGTQIVPYQGVWRPFSGTMVATGLSYLHERDHKRELRLESAQKATAIARSSHADLERGLVFNLRTAFVSTLAAKAVVQLAGDNLAYYDHVLAISRERFKAGDIAQLDLDRLELGRLQYNRTSRAPRSICAPPKSNCLPY